MKITMDQLEKYEEKKSEESTEIPKMEVEELEVINIDLSDHPLPENVTTYDWWWA